MAFGDPNPDAWKFSAHFLQSLVVEGSRRNSGVENGVAFVGDLDRGDRHRIQSRSVLRQRAQLLGDFGGGLWPVGIYLDEGEIRSRFWATTPTGDRIHDALVAGFGLLRIVDRSGRSSDCEYRSFRRIGDGNALRVSSLLGFESVVWERFFPELVGRPFLETVERRRGRKKPGSDGPNQVVKVLVLSSGITGNGRRLGRHLGHHHHHPGALHEGGRY